LSTPRGWLRGNLTDSEIPAKWEGKRLLVGCAGEGQKGKITTNTYGSCDAAVINLFLALTLFHLHHLKWGCVPWVVQTNWNCAVPYKSSARGGRRPEGRELMEKSNNRKIGYRAIKENKN